MSQAEVVRPARVVVIGLGGTIAMTSGGEDGVTPQLSANQLIAAVPRLAETGVRVDTVDFLRRPGASLNFEDLSVLISTFSAEPAAGADGIVVVQGTDTIEETAYLLDLTYSGLRPVVVTGAMRNPTMAGADGPGNLLAAVQTAASRQTRGQGVLVVLADEIHAARRVRKTHSTSVGTFQSPNGGPLGYLVEGRPHMLNAITHRTVVPTPAGAANPRVAIIIVTLGDDGALLEKVDSQFDGLVVAGFGVGHVPERVVPVLTEIAARIPVVLASRAGAGAVLATTYAFAGSESDLLRRGLIRAGFLDAFKARILLRAVLAVTRDLDVIRSAFGVAGGYADPGSWPWPIAPAASG